jgi:hypothetical protein
LQIGNPQYTASSISNKRVKSYDIIIGKNQLINSQQFNKICNFNIKICLWHSKNKPKQNSSW